MLSILALHLVLGVLYSVSVPPWEAHDEWAHYKFVEYVARNRSLPPPDVRLTSEYLYDEANQPPLYYMLAALPVMWVDTEDGVRPDVNPYFDLGSGAGGINAAVHHIDQERFPWRGTVLALYLARVVSLLISLLGLIAVYKLGRLIAPDQPLVSILSLMIASFSPQFLFIGSVVTNDVLIATLGCIIAWLGTELVVKGLRPAPATFLAVSLGLAFVTKLSALSLLPFVLVTFVVGAVHGLRSGRSRRSVFVSIGVPLLAGLGIAITYVVRNLRLTGDIIPRDPWFWMRFVDRWFTRSGNTKPMDLSALPSGLWYGFRTFWASFGWGNLEAYGWVYWLFTVLTLVGLLGCVIWIARRGVDRRRKLAAGLLLLLAVSVVVLAAYRDFDYGGTLVRGRYLLPALAAVTTLIALGMCRLLRLVPLPWRHWMVGGFGVALVVTNTLLPILVIQPAYAAPSEVAPDLLEGERPLHARFDDGAELIGYRIWPEKVKQGEAVGVTLLWRTLRPLDDNYTLAVHLVAADVEKVGEVNVYPGRGNYATTIWEPGRVFRETYWVPVNEAIQEPILGRVKVALYREIGDPSHLPVFDSSGVELGNAVEFGRYKLATNTQSTAATTSPALAALGDSIRLVTATLDQPADPMVPGVALTLTLTWEAVGSPVADYQVFLHLDGAEGTEAYGDGPPAGGLYPTGLWEQGDRIVDRKVVRLPEDLANGSYRLVAGMYDADGVRVSTCSPSGALLPDNQVEIGEVTIRRQDEHNYVPFLSVPTITDAE